MPYGTQALFKPNSRKKSVASKHCNRMKLLNLRRPTPVSDLKNSIPHPKQRPVKYSYPVWQSRELDEKIPMYHGRGPEGPLVLHRGLAGNNPLKANVKLKFSLKDPHSRDVSNTYNSLHDPHLKRWVNLPTNRKFLQKQGLITDDGDVICNLKEYNEYRKFLWRIHNDMVLQKLKQIDQQKLEEKLVFKANLFHKNNVDKKLKSLNYIMSKNERYNVSVLIYF